MATFGLRGQESHSFSSVDHSINGGDHPTPLLPTESNFSFSVPEDNDEDVEPTQLQSQQRQTSYSFDENDQLVAVLTFIGLSHTCDYELRKDHPDKKWTIGRGKKCSIVVDNNQISTDHCHLTWNGRMGQQSEIKLHDTSTNGTRVDNLFLKRGSTILRSGAEITMANARFIFRDIEIFSPINARNVWAKYDIGAELGRGAFAKVNVCVERETGQEYAIKIIDKTRFWSAGKAIKREVAILHELSQFRHEHIVSLYECFDEQESLYLVFERLNGGDLLSYILKRGPLPEDRVRWMAAQMCQAVAYIHQKDVAHRDLKPENVLLTDEGDWPTCKIADFGLAKIVNDQTFLKTTCGTPAYLAPEVVLRPDTTQAYDYKVDSWSLGVILFCMLTKSAPFLELYDQDQPEHERNKYFQNRKVQWDMLDKRPLSAAGRNFLRRLLENDPIKRSTVERMLDHEWIAEHVPSYSKIFPSPLGEPSPTPSSTDQDTLACSQSFQHLNLSDGLTMPIPGLTAAGPDSFEPTPPAIDVEVPSFSSDSSATVKMPGAFPKGRKPPVALLPAIAEGNSETLLDNNDSTATLQRKDYLIAGSSPLSSLSSEEEEESDPPERPKPIPRRQPLNPKKRIGSPPPDTILPKAKRHTARGRAKATTNGTAVRKSTRTRSTKRA